MPFRPGQSGNPAGKPKGIKSKSSEEIRGIFQEFLENNIEQMQADFNQIEPRDRLNFIEKIAKLILPPPLTLENLTDSQLDQLIEKLKSNEQ